jgi:hypothetical protein
MLVSGRLDASAVVVAICSWQRRSQQCSMRHQTKITKGGIDAREPTDAMGQLQHALGRHGASSAGTASQMQRRARRQRHDQRSFVEESGLGPAANRAL